jgi:hypothetical protein
VNPPSPGPSSSAAVSPGSPRPRDLDWLAERIAQRTAVLVLDELDERGTPQPPAACSTPREVADHLRMDVDWVTSHGYELGGFRLGDGPKARWRFPSLDRVDELLRDATGCSAGRESGSAEPRSATSVASKRRRCVSGTRAPLLPIAGEETSEC